MFLPKDYDPTEKFDGTLQLYGFRTCFTPEHVEGRVWASDYTEFINAVHHSLQINGYRVSSTFEWWKIREGEQSTEGLDSV